MAKKGENSFGIASVILAILSIVFGLGILFGSFAGLLLGIIALIFALVQRHEYKNPWSKWGMIIAVIGIILNIVLLVILVKGILQLIDLVKTQIASLEESYGPLSQLM